MKISRFSEEQIIGILKEHQAGLSAKELCRKHGVRDAMFYKWRSKFGGMKVPDVTKLKSLEAENAKLKKSLAEMMMHCMAGYRVAMSREWMSRRSRKCREKLLRPGSRRNAVTWAMKEKRYNQTRACALAGIDTGLSTCVEAASGYGAAWSTEGAVV